jgi:hypothetical protein
MNNPSFRSRADAIGLSDFISVANLVLLYGEIQVQVQVQTLTLAWDPRPNPASSFNPIEEVRE